MTHIWLVGGFALAVLGNFGGLGSGVGLVLGLLCFLGAFVLWFVRCSLGFGVVCDFGFLGLSFWFGFGILVFQVCVLVTMLRLCWLLWCGCVEYSGFVVAVLCCNFSGCLFRVSCGAVVFASRWMVYWC